MRSRSEYPVAPELAVSRWFNTTASPTLADLAGEVVVMEAFQMLCPGCVSHGLPQAMRIQQVFGDALTVLGLHCVFEHHEAMTPVSLEAFPIRVPDHLPGRGRRLRRAVEAAHHHGSIPTAGHPEPGSDRPGGTPTPERVRTDRRPGGRSHPGPPHRRTPPPTGGRLRSRHRMPRSGSGVNPPPADRLPSHPLIPTPGDLRSPTGHRARHRFRSRKETVLAINLNCPVLLGRRGVGR